MKKTGRIIIMIGLFLLLTGCSRDAAADGNSTPEEGNVVGITKQQEWVYVPEVIELGGASVDYENMQLIGDTLCYLSRRGEEVNSTQNICRYSISNKERTIFPIGWRPEGSIWDSNSAYVFDQNYNMWLIANVYSANYSQLKRYLCKFDSEGKNIFSQEITEEMGRGISIDGMIADSQGRIYVYTNEYSDKERIWLYAADGSFQGSLPFGTSKEVFVKGAVEGSDGKIYVCISKGENSESCTLIEVDFEGNKLTELTTDFPNINGFRKGKRSDGNLNKEAEDSGRIDTAAKQYDFLLYDNIFAYGCNLSTTKTGGKPTVEKLFAWADSDVNGYYVTNFGISEDGRYFCMTNDWINDDRCVILLKKTKAEEAPKRVELALAAVNGGSELAAMAVKYNRGNSQYHLTVKNYDSLTDLYNAILAKKAIDIIDLSGLNVEKLSKQGFFEDLLPYLEQSEKFKPSDFLEGILEAYTFDGVLTGIPDAFTMRTVVGDRAQLEGAAGLSLEELLAAASRSPGALPFGGPNENGSTREEVMQYLMMFNEDAFIDWETGECHFDSETFKAILELCSRFPGGDSDRRGSLESEASLPSKIQNGDVLFAIANMNDLKDFLPYEGIFGETAACIGFPTADGKGGTLLYGENAFGIVAASENKSAAWKFVESIPGREIKEGMDADEIYRLYWFPDRLPTLKSTLDIMTDYIIEEDRQRAAKGHIFRGQTYSDGWTYTSHAVTMDEINVILNLVKGAAPAFFVGNDPIITIINEEAPGYYSGQKKVEDVISVIQNRVRLYVDENR